LKQNICQKVITIKNIVIAKTHCGRQLTEIKLSKALIFPISIYWLGLRTSFCLKQIFGENTRFESIRHLLEEMLHSKINRTRKTCKWILIC